MSAQPVDIQIFGRMIRVNCPPDQRDALNQAAADLNKRLHDLKERSRVTNVEQLISIVALNICYELAQERLKNHENVLNIEERIRTLLQSIEDALLEKNSSSIDQNVIFK